MYERIVSDLDQEISTLEMARSILTSNIAPKKPSASTHTKRRMTPEGRAAIAAGQKRRWAKVKKAA